jgi:isopentenyl phosphate kinase
MISFEDLGLLSRANNLAFYELLGDAQMMNQEYEKYHAVSCDDILEYAAKTLTTDQCNTLLYLSAQSGVEA